MTKIPIFLFTLLFLIPFALANTDYNESGNFNTEYQFGTGIFNSNLNPTEISVATKVLTNPKGIPLVSDLDGDGVNEIIVIDLPLIRLFSPLTLDVVAGFNTGKDERISNVLTFDIDDDGFTEIIFVFEESEVLAIYEYNGTSFHNQSNISLNAISDTTNDPEFMIKCGKPENCIMVWNVDVNGFIGAIFTMIGFNSTNISVSGYTSIESGADSDDNYCFPKIRSIAYADYDADGTSEYIFSAMKLRTFGNEEIKIMYVDVSDNLEITTEFERTITSCGEETINPHSTDSPKCNSVVASTGWLSENLFTSPLVFDAEDESDGLETIIGISIDGESYKMCSYFNPFVNTGEMDDYPEIIESDGILLSNPFRANGVIGLGDETSGNNDFCVMGYNNEEEELSLICATERDIALIGDNQYKFSTAGNINITVNEYRKQSMIVHSAQHSTVTTGDANDNLHEIVTSYGIFALNYDEIFEFQLVVIPIRTLDLIFDNPRDNAKGNDGVLISVDAQKLNIEGGSEDLIFMNPTNLYYFDDGRSNSPATITEYIINPCIDSVWKINTSVEITVTVTDPDNDLISARVILYEGSTNEMDSEWSNNVSSGTEIPFPFTANKTIGTGIIELSGRDIENLDSVNTIELTFAVGTHGVEFDDCTTTISITPAEDEEEEEITEATLTVDATDNALTGSLGTVSSLTGLAGLTIWLILMLFLAFMTYSVMAERGLSGNSALGTIAIMEVLMILIGARVGIISTGIVITLVVIGVVIIAIFLGKTFRGDSAEG